MNPEVKLLLALASARESDAAPYTLQKVLNSAPNWKSVVKVAGSHGILEFLHKKIGLLQSGTVPKEIALMLTRNHYATVAANLLQIRELGRVQTILDNEGIQTIAFKGTILAHRAYGSIGLRRSVDIDVIIPDGSFQEVEKILSRIGYQTFSNFQRLSRIGRIVKRRIAQQVPFRRTMPDVNLDVHTAIMPPGYSYHVPYADLLQRSETIEIQGTQVRTCSAEDHLLILCFHGVKNRWESLKYGCDVAQLIRATPALDWDALFHRASSMRASRILHIGLLVAAELFSCDLPQQVSEVAYSDTGAHYAVRRVLSDLARGRTEPLSYTERFQFNLSVQETVMQKLRYCMYALTRRLSLESI